MAKNTTLLLDYELATSAFWPVDRILLLRQECIKTGALILVHNLHVQVWLLSLRHQLVIYKWQAWVIKLCNSV